MSEEKLKSCPFCGGKASMYIAYDDGYYVCCDECGCGLPVYNTEEEAIKIWNQRVADAGKTLTCFKCHGTGIHKAPILNDNGEWADEWESFQCEICRGTGKITLALYEKWQKRMRDKE